MDITNLSNHSFYIDGKEMSKTDFQKYYCSATMTSEIFNNTVKAFSAQNSSHTVHDAFGNSANKYLVFPGLENGCPFDEHAFNPDISKN